MHEIAGHERRFPASSRTGTTSLVEFVVLPLVVVLRFLVVFLAVVLPINWRGLTAKPSMSRTSSWGQGARPL